MARSKLSSRVTLEKSLGHQSLLVGVDPHFYFCFILNCFSDLDISINSMANGLQLKIQAIHWKAQVVKISDFRVVHFFKKCIWLCRGLVAARGILVTVCVMFCCSMQTGIEPRPPALGAWNLNHWTTREVSRIVPFVYTSRILASASLP